MTDQDIPMPTILWEPIAHGIRLELTEIGVFGLPMTSVRELRDDMEEAVMLSRGYERLELDVEEIKPEDVLRIMGHDFVVANLLSGKSYGDEQEWVIQFDLDSFSAVPCEITLPGDQQVTVYRAVA